jgi:hypothetical protein
MLFDRILLAASLAAYFGYYVFAGSLMRGWVYYVMTGMLAVVAGCGLRKSAQSWPGLAGATLMVSEGAQQAVCGLATIGVDLNGQDLCKRALGDDLYTAVASLVCASALVLLWPNPPPRL